MFYYTIKQELVKNNIIQKQDMYLLDGKLLFTNDEAFEKVKIFFENKGFSLVTGKQRNWKHWKQKFTKYMYFENLPYDPVGIPTSLDHT